ncbi:hypothetical protein EAO11_26240 [Klebsiella pneumoniae]|nr:hypothetical protein EAO11_26240 [Klebsiella pneumoniae]
MDIQPHPCCSCYRDSNTEKGKGSSFLLNLAYWFLPTTLMRFFISVLPESYKRHWIA